ncbi:unnamed protein product [Heterosigma akashiwo]
MIYFSAHWCPPCRGFTPVLSEFYQNYKKIEDEDSQIEIVFVSSDQDQAQFNNYYKSMPWTSVDFTNRSINGSLSSLYGVRGIPTLVVLCGETGETKTTSGRSYINPGNPKAVVGTLSKLEPSACGGMGRCTVM